MVYEKSDCMRLVQDLKGLNPNYIIITGDGRREFNILRGLSEIYNGQDIILYFPFSPLFEKTGKKALDSIKILPGYYGISSIIYIVDGDTFKDSFNDEIQNYLRSIGIEIKNFTSIQNALLINCKCGSHNIVLYCIISGPKTFIEEEIVKLINLKWGEEIDLSGIRDPTWKKRVKKEVNQVLKEKKIKLESLIKETEKEKLETSFPNICAILKKIEEEHRS